MCWNSELLGALISPGQGSGLLLTPRSLFGQRRCGDASASRSLNEECWMSGRPLPMSRKAAGVHGCLVVFVWFIGDLSSHCAPYIDVDEA